MVLPIEYYNPLSSQIIEVFWTWEQFIHYNRNDVNPESWILLETQLTKWSLSIK